MQPRDEAAVALWQSYARVSGPIVANAMLHEFYQTPEERAADQAIREAISEPEHTR